MVIFIDTEFIEGKKPFRIFGLPVPNWIIPHTPTIDLISIGLVAGDGRQYYAISKEFDDRNASDWVRNNVISKLPPRFNPLEPAMSKLWKSRNQIAKDIVEFINPGLGWPVESYNNSELAKDKEMGKHFDAHNVGVFKRGNIDFYCAQPMFFGYFGDYDWVVFCWLFGTMKELPDGFPYFLRDLKQTKCETEDALRDYENHQGKVMYKPHPLCDKKEILYFDTIDEFPTYPKQSEGIEHDALEDAKWNQELYNFLRTINF